MSKQLERKTMRGPQRMNERAVTGQDIKDSGLLCNSRKSVRGVWGHWRINQAD